jgi:hypothetical protein
MRTEVITLSTNDQIPTLEREPSWKYWYAEHWSGSIELTGPELVEFANAIIANKEQILAVHEAA